MKPGVQNLVVKNSRALAPRVRPSQESIVCRHIGLDAALAARQNLSRVSMTADAKALSEELRARVLAGHRHPRTRRAEFD
jgi:hypothetical protein